MKGAVTFSIAVTGRRTSAMYEHDLARQNVAWSECFKVELPGKVFSGA